MYECVLFLFFFFLGVALCCVLCVVDGKRIRKREEGWKESLSCFISFNSVFCHVFIFCSGENVTENRRELYWRVEEECSIVLEC